VEVEVNGGGRREEGGEKTLYRFCLQVCPLPGFSNELVVIDGDHSAMNPGFKK
jgi:hypothetical protein